MELNGGPKTFVLHNDIFPSVTVPKGENTLVFEYKNDAVLAGFAVSYLSLLVFAIGIVYHLFLAGTNPRTAVIGTSVMALLLLGGLGAKWLSLDTNDEARAESYERLKGMMHADLASDPLVFLSVDRPEEIGRSISNEWGGKLVNVLPMRLGELSAFDAAIRNSKAETVLYAGSNFAEDRLLIELIREHYPTQSIQRKGREFVHVFNKGEARKALFTSSIDFETPNSAWNYDETRFDSSAQAHSGQLGWSIHTGQMGSPALAVRVGDMTDLKRLKLIYRTWCLVPEGEVSDAGLFVNIERAGQPTWMQAINLNDRAPNHKDWFLVEQLVEPDFDLQPDDVLKMFVWGGEGEAIYLDDQRFTVYPAE